MANTLLLLILTKKKYTFIVKELEIEFFFSLEQKFIQFYVDSLLFFW